MAADQWTLFSVEGGRKYICASELARFIEAAESADVLTEVFCQVLAYTGCRISEALALLPTQIDRETGRVIFRTLKRRRLVFRAVPIPPHLMDGLTCLANDRPLDGPIWTWCRQTAWRKVKAVIAEAGISGPQAMPKGLRHGFGCANAENNIPMATTQKWLGHASLETTAIYQQVIGTEERAFAQRLWEKWQ